MQTIADVGEFGLIAAISAGLPAGPQALVGVGDDAAVLAAPDRRVVATTDLLVEGRHFRRDWSAAADIGTKAAARSLADVAAMGASPTAVLVGLAAPGTLPLAWARELVEGIASECARAGAVVAGGDVSGAGAVTLAVTALGDLGGREPVTRGGARPGDQVACTGRLGWSMAGLKLLGAGLAEPAALITAHRRPQPPYRAGLAAAALGATAMIDVSDGLMQDLGHVARASGVLINVGTGLFPHDGELAAAAAALGLPAPLPWQLTGGEDHALAATFPPGTALPEDWHVIGTAAAGAGVLLDGEAFRGRGGWDHFPG
jgi:thiamine-monophosphate kinase